MTTWSEITPHLFGLAHMATAGSAGRPHVSIVAPALDGDHLWVCTFAGSRKGRNLAANPAAALVWHADGPEAYVQCDATIAADEETKRWIWNSGLLSYNPADFFGEPSNPDMIVVKLTPRSAVVMHMGPDGPRSDRWTA
jgi:general stress protein 26